MEYIVWLPLPVLAFFGYMGFRDGLVKRGVEVVGIVLIILLTGRFATALLPRVQHETGLSEGPALLITWAALFFVGFVVVKLLAILVSKLLRMTILGWIDRWGGVLLGVFVGVLFCSVVLVAISQIPGGRRVQAEYERAAWSRLIFHAAPNIYRTVQGLSDSRAGEIWSRTLDNVREQADEAAETVRQGAGVAAQEALQEQIEELEEKTGRDGG